MDEPVVLLDDGTFFIETHPHYPQRDAPGSLFRRRGIDGRGLMPDVDCLGSFDMHPDTSWSANINIPCLEESGTDARVVMDVTSRMSAIVALWQSRHAAYYRS